MPATVLRVGEFELLHADRGCPARASHWERPALRRARKGAQQPLGRARAGETSGTEAGTCLLCMSRQTISLVGSICYPMSA
jgi:hypothetical protein